MVKRGKAVVNEEPEEQEVGQSKKQKMEMATEELNTLNMERITGMISFTRCKIWIEISTNQEYP